MSNVEVHGIPADDLYVPINQALSYVTWATGNGFEFSPEEAADLSLTTDGRYSAKSESPISRGSVDTGIILRTLVFGPGDGTGAPTPEVASMVTSEQQVPDNQIPRMKDTERIEVYFPIATVLTAEEDHTPNICAGHLEVLGVEDDHIQPIGYLGQELVEFLSTIHKKSNACPTAQLTFGGEGEESFGNPHALTYPTDVAEITIPEHIQICAVVEGPREDENLNELLSQLSAVAMPQYTL